jgi:hypothetical protein
MDRRTLLKSAAALSAAVVVPVTIAEAAPAVVQPLKLSPYVNHVWQWFVSHDKEVYYEAFETMEQAIEYGKACGYSFVAECQQQDFRLEVDAERVLEWLNEDNYEQIGEGGGVECTSAQQRDLSDMLTRALEAWVVKHSINITAWSFADTKNETTVSRPNQREGT